MEFNFNLKTNVVFGPGKRRQLNQFIKKNNYKNILIIIEDSILKVPIFKEFINGFNFNYQIIKCKNIEPTYETLDQHIDEIKKNNNLDLFIGIGGGTIIDLTKGLAVLFKNKSRALDYRGFDKFSKKPLPIIAIPTTSGTGSEITPNASFIDTVSKKKMGINGEGIRPIFSILDPDLTISCPLLPTISAGLDSMVHATEAFISKKTNPFAKIFAKEGYQTVIKYLPLVAKDLNNKIHRERVMYGAFLSAIALMHSGTGPSAAMSYPLEVYFKIPHGIAGAAFLPLVTKYNISKKFYNYSLLNRQNHGNNRQEALNFLKELKICLNRLNVSKFTRGIIFNDKLYKNFIDDTLELKKALDQNPIKFGNKEVQAILNDLIKEDN